MQLYSMNMQGIRRTINRIMWENEQGNIGLTQVQNMFKNRFNIYIYIK